VAAKAGVTKQTLLRHFGSKDGLALQALMRGAAQIRDQRWKTPTNDIAGAVDNLLDHYEAWGERSLRMRSWQQDSSPMLVMISQAARQVHYEWVEYAFAPWLDELDEDALARRRAAMIAICDLPATGMSLVATTAAHDPQQFSAPPGARVVRFASHEAILARARQRARSAPQI